MNPGSAHREPVILGAVLVGGSSTRLASEKALLEVAGVSMVERVLPVLGPLVSEVVLVGKAGDSCPVPGVRFVTEDHPDRCAMAGAVRALEEGGRRRTAVVACDHPLLSGPLIELLLHRSGVADARVPMVRGRLQPLVAVYEPAAALPVFWRRLSEGRPALVRALNELVLDVVPEPEIRAVDPDLRSFLNVNRPEDLERAESLASSRDGQKG